MSTEALNNEIENSTSQDDFVEGVERQQDGTTAGGGGDNGGSTTPSPQTNNELRDALAKLTENVATLAKPKEEAPRQMTPEESAEHWGIFQPEKVDPDFFKKWLRLNSDMDPAEQAKVVAEYKGLFDKFQHGVARQAVIGARNLFMEEIKKRDDRLAVLESHYSNAEKTRIRSSFESSYPAFSDRETYGDILKIVATNLSQQRFADEPSYFKALAEGAAALVKKVKPDFDLGQSPTKTNRSSTNTPRLPRTSVGGTGGSAGGGGGNQNDGKVHRGKNGDDAETLIW